MRGPPHDVKAAKRTVSLARNSDLAAPQVAEAALAAAVARRHAEQVRAEIRQDLEAISAYEATHGSFAEMARAHHADEDE